MKTRYFILLPLLTFTLWSCYKDKGNYDYLPSDAVTIEFPDLGTTIVGTPMDYTPTVTTRDTDAKESDFEYRWDYTGMTNGSSAWGDATEFETICETKTLTWVPNRIGNNVLRFYVREKSTGVITEKALTVNVSTYYDRGWLVLSEQDGKSVLSFVHPGSEMVNSVKTRKFTPWPDVYTTLFPLDADGIGTGPSLLRCEYGGASFGGSIVYVFQDDEPVILSGNTFGKQGPFSDMIAGTPPAGFHPKSKVSFQANPSFQLLLSTDGKVYSRFNYDTGASFFANLYSSVPISFENKELHIDQLPVMNISQMKGQFLVDNDQKRVLCFKQRGFGPGDMTGTGTVARFTYTDTPDFDYRGWGDRTPLHINGTWNNMCVTTVYKKAGSDKVYWQIARGPQWGVFPVLEEYPLRLFENGEFPDDVTVNESTVFFNMPANTYDPYLFIGTGNELWRFDTDAYVFNHFYTLPEGEVIVDIDNNPQETELVVVTRGGLFTVLDITRANIAAGKKIYDTRLPRNVIDLEYKYQNFNGYAFRFGDF